MFIAATTPEVPPSSVGAAWVGVVALRQGFGEAGGAPGHKHAAPTGLGESGGAFGYKHVAPTGLDGLGGTRGANPKKTNRTPFEFGIKINVFVVVFLGGGGLIYALPKVASRWCCLSSYQL